MIHIHMIQHYGVIYIWNVYWKMENQNLTNYIFGFQEVNNCISCKPTDFILC